MDRPPKGNRQEAVHRPLAGILQPSVGIPTCELGNDEEEDDEMIGKNDDCNNRNMEAKNYQPSYQNDKTHEVSLADFTHDQTTFAASSSFATAAHMASTPFCYGIGPSSLPSIPWSTIRPTNENAELNELASDEVEYPSAHASVVQSGGSFTSTPSKVLSPIFEGSHEDSKSTNSSHSSNGSSRPGSCSVTVSQFNGLELSKIQEETSACQTDTAPQDTTVGSAVINPFAGDVVDSFLRRITPPLSTYEGFIQSSDDMPRIATNASVCFGKCGIVLLQRAWKSPFCLSRIRVYPLRPGISEISVNFKLKTQLLDDGVCKYFSLSSIIIIFLISNFALNNAFN